MRNPGWIDLQVNGCGGVDFSDPELTRDAFLRAAEQVFESGTERFLPTFVTSPFPVYRRNLALICDAVDREGLVVNVPGVTSRGRSSRGIRGPLVRTIPSGSFRRNRRRSTVSSTARRGS